MVVPVAAGLADGLATGLGEGLAAAVDGALPPHAAASNDATATAAVNRTLDRMHPDTAPGYVALTPLSRTRL
jgi:hypothetical protein